MATITLRKSKFDNIKNVLDKLGANFKNYQASLNELKHTAEALNSDECNLEETINDIASSDKSEKDKVEKIQQLNRKIENFVNTAIQKEKAAKREIVKQKKDFYKKYKNLEPDCEKSYLKRAVEKYVEITKAINQWVLDHIDIIITAIIVLAAVVICIFCPAAVVAVIGIIAGALSAAMGIADMVCMSMNGGKGIAETLAENGHGTLAKIWSGTSNGFDIASIILPAGAGLKAISGTAKVTLKSSLKNSVKNFSKHPFKNIGKGIKSQANSIKTGFKSSVTKFTKHPFKSIGKGIKSITGFDDIENAFKLLKGNNFSKTVSKNVSKEIGEKIIQRETLDETTENLVNNINKKEKKGNISDNNKTRRRNVKLNAGTGILDENAKESALKRIEGQTTDINGDPIQLKVRSSWNYGHSNGLEGRHLESFASMTGMSQDDLKNIFKHQTIVNVQNAKINREHSLEEMNFDESMRQITMISFKYLPDKVKNNLYISDDGKNILLRTGRDIERTISITPSNINQIESERAKKAFIWDQHHKKK